jgi:hypothetical protein
VVHTVIPPWRGSWLRTGIVVLVIEIVVDESVALGRQLGGLVDDHYELATACGNHIIQVLVILDVKFPLVLEPANGLGNREAHAEPEVDDSYNLLIMALEAHLACFDC